MVLSGQHQCQWEKSEVGVFAGPDVSESGLVLALDGANSKSFRGQSIDNMYYISNGGSANSSIWHMPMGGTATGTYTTSHSYGTWNGNTIFEVTVSAGTIPGGYESFRDCISASLNATYGSTRRLTAKVRMIKGTIATLGVHNGGANGEGTYTTFNEYLVPKDVNIKDGWYLLDTDVSGSYSFGQCVGIGILSADIKFLVTEMMVHNTSNSVRFTPTTRGTTVATGGGWTDLTGRGNNGELVNGVKESGDNLGSLSFDGTDDYVSAGTLSGSFASFTVIIWFYPTSVSNYQNPIDCNYSYNGTTGNIGPRLEMNSSGTLAWNYSNITGDNNQFYSHSIVSSGLAANTWHCTAVTYNGGTNTSTTYYNGNPTGLSRISIGSPTGFVGTMNNIILGKGFHLGGAERIFAGRISNTQIYNRALTAAEVQQNFNALRGRFGI